MLSIPQTLTAGDADVRCPLEKWDLTFPPLPLGSDSSLPGQSSQVQAGRLLCAVPSWFPGPPTWCLLPGGCLLPAAAPRDFPLAEREGWGLDPLHNFGLIKSRSRRLALR